MDRLDWFGSLLAKGEKGRARLALEVGNSEADIDLADVLLRAVAVKLSYFNVGSGWKVKLEPQTQLDYEREGIEKYFLEKGCRYFIFNWE